tara:strand:- start:334 stop:6702 length:6369 start_codon:yes stop_codon:yes gene_type:complete
MTVKKDINSDIEALLVSNGVFEYAHLIKFERPNAPDNLQFRTNANRYAYFTDASRDISFDDGSTDHDGNANGAQIYRANRVKSLGSYSETIQAKSTSMNLVLGAEHLNTSVSVTGTLANAGTFAYSSGFSTEEFDFVELGFREGDLVSFTRNDGTAINDGTNSTTSAKYIITGFTNSNQNLTLARTGNDTNTDFFDIGFPSSDISTAFTISLESDELRGVLAIESNTLSTPTFFNREVFIYKIFIDPETGAVIGAGDSTKINGILIFKGIINSCSLNEKTTGSTVTWNLNSHWGDFYERKGRITSDAAHRGLDAQMRPQPQQALRPLHAADMGFLHSETSLTALAEYQRIETRKEYKMHSHLDRGFSGLFGISGARNYEMEEVEVEEVINEQVNFDLGLSAQKIPLVYGVRKVDGIPVFADTDKDNPRIVHVIYAIAEGEVQGLYNLHIDGTSVICTDQVDFDSRNGLTGTAKDDVKMVCYGRMATGQTTVGLDLETLSLQLLASQTATNVPDSAITEPASEETYLGNILGVRTWTTNGPGFSFDMPTAYDFSGLYDFTKIGASLPQANIETVQPTTPAASDSTGLSSQETLNLPDLFGDEFDISLTFMRGTPDQGALNQLVSIADQKRFKRQVDYYDVSGKNLPYWSQNHRLLDTAYLHVRYELGEDMTEIPEFEYTLRGKVYENYNYDNTYVADPATTNFVPRNGSTNNYQIRENDVITVEVSFNNGSSFETAKTSSGSTSFRVLDVYEFVNRLGNTEFRYRLDETPYFRNDGSTRLSPNGVPTFDKIRLNKSGTTWTMLPWNAGSYKTAQAFPSQKKDITSFGFSGGKLQINTSSSDGTTLAATGDVFQLMPRTAGDSLTGDLQHFRGNVFRASHSSGTFTLTDTRNYTSNPSASASNYSIQSARKYDLSSISGFSSKSSSEIEGQFLQIVETGEEREITNKTGGVIQISSAFIFPPDSNNTFRIVGNGRDLRAGTNPAMQLLDYMTNQIYGKDLDLETDIDLESFTATAKLCDTRSDVTVKLSSGTPTVGNRYTFNPSDLNDGSGTLTLDATRRGPTFSGKVKSFDSSTNLVTFTECTGKIFYEWNNYRTFDKGDIIASKFPASGTASFSQYQSNESGLLATDPAVSSSSLTRAMANMDGTTTGFRFTDGSTTLIMDTAVEPTYSLYNSDFVKYWRYLGWEHHHQRWVTRHQTNFVIDTSKSVFENVNLILQHFSGILAYENGKYVLGIKTQESAPVSTKTFNGTTYNENVNPYFIEKSDIIGDIKLTDNSNKNSKNLVKATVPDPALAYDNRNISFLNADYLKADRNIRKTGSLQFSGITNYFNGRINAERYLTESRYGKEVTFKVGQKGLLMKPGQVLGLTYEPFGFTNKLFRILNLNFNADCTVSIKAREYDDAAYIISAQQKTQLFSENSGVELKAKAPGAPTNFTVTAPGDASPGEIRLSWTNATDFNEVTDFTEIWHESNSNTDTQNNRNNAVRIATVKGSVFNHFQTAPDNNNFFWIRHKRIQPTKGQSTKTLFSAYNPTSATGGVQLTSLALDSNAAITLDKQAITVALDAAGAVSTSDVPVNVQTQGFGTLNTTTEFRLFELDGSTAAVGCTFTNNSTTSTGTQATIKASSLTATSTPKLLRATTTVNSGQGAASGQSKTTFASVNLQRSDTDQRRKVGLLYYFAAQPAGQESAVKSQLTSSSQGTPGYDFDTQSFLNLNGTNWVEEPPAFEPPSGQSDTSRTFYYIKYTLTEITTGTNKGKAFLDINTDGDNFSTNGGTNSFALGNASTFVDFTRAVRFTDIENDTSTVIHGSNITTGVIQSSNYQAASSQPLGFDASQSGTKFDLSNGVIQSEKFLIDSNGNASFSGVIKGNTVVLGDGAVAQSAGTTTGFSDNFTSTSTDGSDTIGGPQNTDFDISGFINQSLPYGPITLNGVSTKATRVAILRFQTPKHAPISYTNTSGQAASTDTKFYMVTCSISPVGNFGTSSASGGYGSAGTASGPQRYFALSLTRQDANYPTGTQTITDLNGVSQTASAFVVPNVAPLADSGALQLPGLYTETTGSSTTSVGLFSSGGSVAADPTTLSARYTLQGDNVYYVLIYGFFAQINTSSNQRGFGNLTITVNGLGI